MKRKNIPRANEIDKRLERLASLERSMDNGLTIYGDGGYQVTEFITADFSSVIKRNVMGKITLERNALLKELESL